MNRFTSFPVMPESPTCQEGCGVKNSSSHCRLAISFSNNQIKKFEPNPFRDLRCLQTLDLSYNDIKGDVLRPLLFDEEFVSLTEHTLFSTQGLRVLDQLDLTENELTYFSEHIFGDLIKLRDLRLRGNYIKGFHDNAFYKDSPLLNLDLTNNRLQDIPYPAINKLMKLRTLDLSENPIQKAVVVVVLVVAAVVVVAAAAAAVVVVVVVVLVVVVVVIVVVVVAVA
ncbi:leucine-rich repeat and immunoglobulin domain-containing nogo receptor-interacting protein [Elysia marginata]|uniref:Leucine-rich repeat and immunoglobulin domain-containing nogo receptor-interacting protein n=1 Tax=Elysia marginata TaxID=1093978 RepID=A0AAV4IAI6_9GAST|nr:leucine-rich repeat and immunoglobulin domain-containing nogo receptor-interacting protein [Elysia marginata]